MDDGAAFGEARRRLLARIDEEIAETGRWTGRDRLSAPVASALAAVARERFVPPAERMFAYDNRPLAIGHGQTISQPFIVAIMSELLDVTPTDRVLEIGTGCGYQTAVLAEIAGRVHSIEVVPELAADAVERLRQSGYRNVEIRVADGWRGWPEAAPFDAIMVTAAPPTIPQALVAQLRIGGRLVLPLGERHETQMLLRCVKRNDGGLDREEKLAVAFVPMIRAR
jgi:protein-L-isoaspartate(D-aspartate) O-methyltransferase